MPTRPFGFPVCDSAQPEDDGTLVLLHNLQEQNHNMLWFSQQATENRKSWLPLPFLFTEDHRLSSSPTLTQNQIVMGQRTMAKMADSMTKNQPMHPRDPVRSAGWREKYATLKNVLDEEFAINSLQLKLSNLPVHLHAR